MTRWTAVAVALSAAVLGCGEPRPTTFIALERDFQPFEGWERFHLEGESGDDIHTSINRDIYLSERPRRGSTEFPVGTMIVKWLHGATDAETRIFAMAKRGGTYDAEGAVGWEWFELAKNNDNWVIAWRGLGPPAGAGYTGGTRDQVCNECHLAAAANDYVKAAVLDLGGF